MSEPRAPVVFVLPDLAGGGAQRVILSLAGALDPVKFPAHLLVLGGSKTLVSEVPAHVPRLQGAATQIRYGVPWLLRETHRIGPAAYVSVMGYMNLMLLALKPLLPKPSRVIVREANTLRSTLDAMPKAIPGRALYRALYARADAIVCPTAELAGDLSALSSKLASRSVVLPNPVNIEALAARAASPQRHPGPGPRFVCAGRLTKQKGFDQLIDMLPHFPPASHVTVLGEGADRAALEAQAERLGVSSMISFAGFARDLPAWIAGADAFLLPSRWEGLPNVVLEALAVGTPAVISDQVAAMELAHHTPPGAVVIAPPGPEFIAAAAHLAAGAASRRPRSSLLPDIYAKENVVAQWEQLLAQTWSARAR